MNEIDSRLRVDPNGIVLHLGADAMPARLEEWLRTPEGSVWGWPSWGNPIRRFQHEPTNEYTAVALENFMIDKLRADLPEQPLMGVRCNAVAIDTYQAIFYYGTGIYEAFLQREGSGMTI